MQPLVDMVGIAQMYSLGSFAVAILNRLDLSIWAGDYVAVLGTCDSGKAALANILACRERASSGDYRLQGISLVGCSAEVLAQIRRQRLGLLFQQPNLLPRASALENVMVALAHAPISKELRQRRAVRSLRQVGLGAHLHSLPAQLTLSQQQRVAIARAIVKKPLLLLADEPTRSLDTQATSAILHLFHTLNQQGLTIVIMTDSAAVASQCKRTILLQSGQIIAC